MTGADIELQINAPIFVKHFQELADLAAEGVFRYGGRTSEAKQLFLSGECGMLTDSSGGLGDVIKSGIDYGTGPAPLRSERCGRAAEHDSRAAPASGCSPAIPPGDYEGVAAFFEFLSQTDVQSRLHQVSGYLPVTMAAYDATKASGFYEANPGREQPILQMIGKPPTENSRGIRAINLPELRDDPERGVRGDARGSAIGASRRSTMPCGAAMRRSRPRSIIRRHRNPRQRRACGNDSQVLSGGRLILPE